nr:immunoglobulin light chain junction region [Macaca mulatta]MPO03127.1 immunoglobulin light chain junction region [Macaca mulatta]MPO03259.1 immunoglobulin light chain junction region [Macaca mulatta]MPO03396.1 immunoglobulin light chain junction region [Macaca mulatta]MPO03506.1 immunoglobulin light chain junction region [Macaca mulatta]
CSAWDNSLSTHLF